MAKKKQPADKPSDDKPAPAAGGGMLGTDIRLGGIYVTRDGSIGKCTLATVHADTFRLTLIDGDRFRDVSLPSRDLMREAGGDDVNAQQQDRFDRLKPAAP